MIKYKAPGMIFWRRVWFPQSIDLKQGMIMIKGKWKTVLIPDLASSLIITGKSRSLIKED